MATEQGYVEELAGTWRTLVGYDPAVGSVSSEELAEIREDVDALLGSYKAELAALEGDERDELAGVVAGVLARAAVLAFAAGDRELPFRWLQTAERTVPDTDTQELLEAAMRKPERFHMLVHGRYLMAHELEKQARALWKQLASGDDAIAGAAKEELAAPRPLTGDLPTLWRWNGCGLGFYGSRDRWPDGSYVTTHCISLVFVPLIPLKSYRVRDDGDGYMVMAREQLSKFARGFRSLVLLALLIVPTVLIVDGYINSPERKATRHFAAELAAIDKQSGDAALQRLDGLLASGDASLVNHATIEKVGAEIVTRTAKLVPEPFTKASLDQAGRLVRRYQALPAPAREGAARDAILAILDRWVAVLDKPEDQDAKLALLRHEANVVDANRSAGVSQRIATTRIAAGTAKAETAPLHALAILVESPRNDESIAAAGKLLERLADSPSLLDDAGSDVEAWIASVGAADPLRQRIELQLALGRQARAEAEAEGVTKEALEAMQKQRPWDQRAALGLAHFDLQAGKVDAAQARLAKLGPPALLVRDAQLILGRLAMEQGKLEEADELFTRVLAARLDKFQLVSAELETVAKEVQGSLEARLRAGDLPPDVLRRAEAALPEEQQEIVGKWFAESMDADPRLQKARTAYMAFGDVVPASLAAGSAKLRRAQELSGAARDAKLAEAEQMFLSVRGAAEGQPEFHLGLGEIYARLGKTTESEAELKSVLDRKDPELTLQVVHVYRGIGSTDRAKQIAVELHKSGASPYKEAAAMVLGVLTGEDDVESERWFRLADQKAPFVRTSLLEIEGQRLMRQGKYAECARKFEAAAKAHLERANETSHVGHNNAAIAHQNRFACSGDMTALKAAEQVLEQAYRANSAEPIVIANLSSMLDTNIAVRAISKRVDTKALRITQGDAGTLVDLLVDGTEGAALLADLKADPAWRRTGDLMGQYEVLAPNSTFPYQNQMQRASRLRDPVMGAAIVERMKRAKSLDRTRAETQWKSWLDGSDDATMKQQLDSDIERYQQALAKPRLDPRTRAAALALQAYDLQRLGTMFADAAAITRARANLEEASKLWPALDVRSTIARAMIDEAAMAVDSKRWAQLRREYSAVAALATLAQANDALAAKVRASDLWKQALATTRTVTTRPDLDELRLARLAGDAALETRARAVLDDQLIRLSLDVSALSLPSAKQPLEDIAYWNKR